MQQGNAASKVPVKTLTLGHEIIAYHGYGDHQPTEVLSLCVCYFPLYNFIYTWHLDAFGHIMPYLQKHLMKNSLGRVQ